MADRRHKKDDRALWVGTLLGGAALAVGAVYYFTRPKTTASTTASGGSAAPGVTNLTDNGPGSFWASLSSVQQDAYRTSLWDWVNNNPNTWPSTIETPAQAGITSVASLSDIDNLTLATDGYQTAHNFTNANGVVDQATFNGVTSGQ